MFHSPSQAKSRSVRQETARFFMDPNGSLTLLDPFHCLLLLSSPQDFTTYHTSYVSPFQFHRLRMALFGHNPRYIGNGTHYSPCRQWTIFHWLPHSSSQVWASLHIPHRQWSLFHCLSHSSCQDWTGLHSPHKQRPFYCLSLSRFQSGLYRAIYGRSSMPGSLSLPPAPARFLLGLLFGPEDPSNTIPPVRRALPNYTARQPR